MPRSPWLASPDGERAGEPVEARVAAIFAADMAVLAHTRDHDAAGALNQDVDGLHEAVAEAVSERADAVGLDPRTRLATARSSYDLALLPRLDAPI